jgi:predicted TIM-barrel fold metal-dependent hydrolase
MATTNAHRIDVHHHFFAPEYVAEIGRQLTGQRVVMDWSPTWAIDDMDEGEVATSITSVTTPGIWVGDAAKSARLARICNEYAAQLARDYPGRYGFWAAIPLPDTDASLREIEYALDTLHADGIGLITSYGDKWLGDPSFDAVFEELNRRGAIVYTHPTAAPSCTGLIPDIPDAIIEFGTDTTRAIARWLFTESAVRYPNIHVIWSHGGGTMPFLWERFLRASQAPNLAARLPNGVLNEVRRFYYDTAQASNEMTLASLTRLIPLSQILYGTDAPYRNAREYGPMLREWGFSEADLEAIERGNALRLLPRLQN